jgi:hypothetical protein
VPEPTETRTRHGVLRAVVGLVKDALEAFWTLAKVMVPVIILTRILQQVGVVEALGRAIAPAMGLVGLPGSMGLVWATGMLVNMYGGLVVFASIGPAASLTSEQATVLGCMILVAHSLPVELRIAQKAGPRLRAIAPLRVLGALCLGWIVHAVCSGFGLLQGPCSPLIKPSPPDPSWLAWGLGQAENLVRIFFIILALLTLLSLLKWLRITDLLLVPLMPVLRALGLSEHAAPLTIVGMTLGITYGGGLIIRESRSGQLSSRDVFFSLALLSLCHSLIEDTLLMVAIGSDLVGVLFGRLLFGLAVVFVLARIFGRLPDERFERFLVRPQHRGKDGHGGASHSGPGRLN